MLISALYVENPGCYFGIPGVDPWDVDRNAKLYAGPFPVVAHPPCQRWGRYWSGGPSAKVRRKLGDDDGCFAAALACVRAFGGVLEHPEASHAWAHFGLQKPPKKGGWIRADGYGWTCCVEQGHYGHPARKATWLYAVSTDLPELIWGKAEGKRRLDGGFRSSEERARFVAQHGPSVRTKEILTRSEKLGTPEPFRNLLLLLALSVTHPGVLSPRR